MTTTRYPNKIPPKGIVYYQSANRWLKNYDERTLDFDDLLHYQQIIAASNETHRLM